MYSKRRLFSIRGKEIQAKQKGFYRHPVEAARHLRYNSESSGQLCQNSGGVKMIRYPMHRHLPKLRIVSAATWTFSSPNNQKLSLVHARESTVPK
jgi:hypothetical protein